MAIFFGFAHMRFLRRFGPLTLLSCAAWALVLIGMGYSFSGAIFVVFGRVKRAGIAALDQFTTAVDAMRAAVRKPTAKGAVSTAVSPPLVLRVIGAVAVAAVAKSQRIG